jgi:hypothetical protein
LCFRRACRREDVGGLEVVVFRDGLGVEALRSVVRWDYLRRLLGWGVGAVELGAVSCGGPVDGAVCVVEVREGVVWRMGFWETESE